MLPHAPHPTTVALAPSNGFPKAARGSPWESQGLWAFPLPGVPLPGDRVPAGRSACHCVVAALRGQSLAVSAAWQVPASSSGQRPRSARPFLKPRPAAGPRHRVPLNKDLWLLLPPAGLSAEGLLFQSFQVGFLHAFAWLSACRSFPRGHCRLPPPSSLPSTTHLQAKQSPEVRQDPPLGLRREHGPSDTWGWRFWPPDL